MSWNDLRIQRRRQEDLLGGIERPHDPGAGTPALLGQVYNAGSMPTSLPGRFAVHPVRVLGIEKEGVVQTYSVDTSRTLTFTVVGSTVPTAGDVLVGKLIDGRWVAKRGLGGVSAPCPYSPWPSPLYLTTGGTTTTLTWSATNNRWEGLGHITAPVGPAFCDCPGGVYGGSFRTTGDVLFIVQCRTDHALVIQYGIQIIPCNVTSPGSGFCAIVNWTTGSPSIFVLMNNTLTSFTNSPLSASGHWLPGDTGLCGGSGGATTLPLGNSVWSITQ